MTHFQDVVCCQFQTGSAWQLVLLFPDKPETLPTLFFFSSFSEPLLQFLQEPSLPFPPPALPRPRSASQRRGDPAAPPAAVTGTRAAPAAPNAVITMLLVRGRPARPRQPDTAGEGRGAGGQDATRHRRRGCGAAKGSHGSP